FWHGLTLYRTGAISLGDVVAYVGLIGLFGFPVFTSLFAYSQMSSGLASARRILELIRSETELDRNVAGHAAPIEGNIEFRNATLNYNPDDAGSRAAVEDVSF